MHVHTCTFHHQCVYGMCMQCTSTIIYECHSLHCKVVTHHIEYAILPLCLVYTCTYAMCAHTPCILVVGEFEYPVEMRIHVYTPLAPHGKPKSTPAHALLQSVD